MMAAAAALLLGACASQGNTLTTTGSLGPAPASPAHTPAPPVETVSRLPAEGGYVLTAADRELDCRTLTGRMAVRIMQLRDYENRLQATSVSRAVQTTASPVFGGGSTAGLDPDGRYARDRAQLAAYNALLAEKNCANFDLEAELNPAAKGPPRAQNRS